MVFSWQTISEYQPGYLHNNLILFVAKLFIYVW